MKIKIFSLFFIIAFFGNTYSMHNWQSISTGLPEKEKKEKKEKKGDGFMETEFSILDMFMPIFVSSVVNNIGMEFEFGSPTESSESSSQDESEEEEFEVKEELQEQERNFRSGEGAFRPKLSIIIPSYYDLRKRKRGNFNEECDRETKKRKLNSERVNKLIEQNRFYVGLGWMQYLEKIK